MESSTATSSPVPSIPPDPFTRIEITLPPDVTATILGLANLADEVAVSHPAKAQDLRSAINDMIRSSLSWDIS